MRLSDQKTRWEHCQRRVVEGCERHGNSGAETSLESDGPTAYSSLAASPEDHPGIVAKARCWMAAGLCVLPHNHHLL